MPFAVYIVRLLKKPRPHKEGIATAPPFHWLPGRGKKPRPHKEGIATTDHVFQLGNKIKKKPRPHKEGIATRL